MKINIKYKSYFIWLIIINSTSFIGGVIDAILLVPVIKKDIGGLVGFPMFTLYGIGIGVVIGIVYSIVNIVINVEQSRVLRVIQLIISIVSIGIPLFTIIGGILGLIIGYILVIIFG